MQPLERAYKFEGFTLDLRRGCLRSADGEIELRPKSFEVLRYLVENAGRLVPKDEIISAVWPNVIVTDESLARCVSDVRVALGDRGRRIIRTVPRRCYLFAAEPEVNVASPIRAESNDAVVSQAAAALPSVFTELVSGLPAAANDHGSPLPPQLPERRQMT